MPQTQMTEQEAVDNFVSSASNNDMADFNEDLAYLLENNISINALDVDGDTALCLACAEANLEIVKLLLKQNSIDVNQKGDDGEAPIHFACMDNNTNVLKCLLSHENIDLENKNNEEGLTTLEMSIAIDDREKVADILIADKRTNVNALSANGSTMLIVAVLLQRYDIVKSLLANPSIDINLEAKSSMDITSDNINQSATLLEDLLSNADNASAKKIEATNAIENEAVAASSTALGMAIVMGDPVLVKLISAHRDIKISEVMFSVAKFFGHEEITEHLKALNIS
ncbi:MAG: ankyrin repeat protein [Alphaproteobacteria bacterium]|jgi:ankyrin repeat protein